MLFEEVYINKFRNELSKIKMVALKYNARNAFDSLEKLLLRGEYDD